MLIGCFFINFKIIFTYLKIIIIKIFLFLFKINFDHNNNNKNIYLTKINYRLILKLKLYQL